MNLKQCLATLRELATPGEAPGSALLLKTTPSARIAIENAALEDRWTHIQRRTAAQFADTVPHGQQVADLVLQTNRGYAASHLAKRLTSLSCRDAPLTAMKQLKLRYPT